MVAFYNTRDQEIYNKGFSFIPQERFRIGDPNLNAPTTTDDPLTGGVATIPMNMGGGDGGFNPYNTDMSKVRQDYDPFPSRQAGEIYSTTFNPQPFTDPNQLGVRNAQIMYNKAAADLADPFNRSALTQTFTAMRPSKEVMDFYGEKILDNQEKYRTQGQYIDPYDPNYSSMTEANKFMDNYPEYYGVNKKEIQFPGILGMAQNFVKNILPINERAIMENEARGAGIFTDDIGRIVTNDYNTAGGIMAGYNLNKIDASTFDKRRDMINKNMSDRINPKTGKTFKQERLDLLDEAEAQILGARKKTQQIYKMRKDKKAADKKRKEDEAAAAAAAAAAADKARKDDIQRIQRNLNDTGVTGRNYDQAANLRGGGGGNTARNALGQTAREATYAGTGTAQGYSQHYMDGGRVYYMDGGLANLVDIYD